MEIMSTGQMLCRLDCETFLDQICKSSLHCFDGYSATGVLLFSTVFSSLVSAACRSDQLVILKGSSSWLSTGRD